MLCVCAQKKVEEVSDSDGNSSSDNESKPSPPPSNFSTPGSAPGSSPPQLLTSKKGPLTVTPAQGANRKALRAAQKAAQKDTEKRLTRAMSGAFSRATSMSEGSFETGSNGSGSGDTGTAPPPLHARGLVPPTIDESALSEGLQKLQPSTGRPPTKTTTSKDSPPETSTSNQKSAPAAPRARLMPESVPLPIGFPEPSVAATSTAGAKMSPSLSPLQRSSRPRPRVGSSIVAEVSAASSARLLVMSTPSAIASGRAPSLEASRRKALTFRNSLSSSYTNSKSSRSRSRKTGSGGVGDGGGGDGDGSGVNGNKNGDNDNDNGNDFAHIRSSSLDFGLGGGSSSSLGSLGLPRPLHQGPGACAAFRSSTERLAASKPPLGLDLEYDLPLHQRAAVLVADAGKLSGAFARETRHPLFEAHDCSDLAYGARFVEHRPVAKNKK